MAIADWSTNPANNTLVGAINWSEGQLPGTVNGSARQMMADVAVWRDSLASSASAYALAAGQIFGGAVGRDANFYLDLQSGNPVLNFDAFDYFQYDRTNDVMTLFMGAQQRLVARQVGNFDLYGTGFLRYNNSNVWTAASDGAGSGLDADLWRGQTPAAFQAAPVAEVLNENGGYISYPSGRKECWGYIDIPQDSFGTFNLPVAHTSWVNPVIGPQARLNSSANENTGIASIVGTPPTGIQIYNAENQTLRVWVRTVGV